MKQSEQYNGYYIVVNSNGVPKSSWWAMEIPKPISAPADVLSILHSIFDGVEVEHFVVVCLDSRNRPIKVEVIAKGAVDRCPVDVRSVFCQAVRCLATSVIVAHNHPSGDTSPSPEDLELTKKLVSAGDILGVAVLDHFIVATGQFAKPNSYLSMAEQGLIK